MTGKASNMASIMEELMQPRQLGCCLTGNSVDYLPLVKTNSEQNDS